MHLNLGIGDVFEGCEIIAIHQQDDHGLAGVVLTYNPTDRYIVWTVSASPDGAYATDADTYPTDSDAYFRYAERVAKQLFRYHNKVAPGLSYIAKNNG